MTGRESSVGALTCATGNLTPEGSREPFVPAERREVADPEVQADVTVRQGANAPAQSGDVGEPGSERPEDGLTELATRESGYGSESGLSPNDPAYRMESRPGRRSEPTHPDASDGETRIGGDEMATRDEHF